MENFYFTFGQNHYHPSTGESMRNYWIKITANNENDARNVMFEKFGEKWCFSYTEEGFEGSKRHFPQGEYAHFTIRN